MREGQDERDFIVIAEDGDGNNVVYFDKAEIEQEINRNIGYKPTHKDYDYLKELAERAEPYVAVENVRWRDRPCIKYRTIRSMVTDLADLVPLCKALDMGGVAYKIIMDGRDQYGVYTLR